MSEVTTTPDATTAKRKEKCENCTKQCNKKNTEEEASAPLQEKHEANGEVNGGSQLLLSACLSCDGCVSEEESLKISQQNLEQINRVLALNKKCDVAEHKVLVVSLCPQSLPFFAVKFDLDIAEATRKLCSFLKGLGVQHVFDTTVAAGFSILESQREFVQRYRRRHHDSQALPMFTSSCPGWIRYAERVLGSVVTPHICTARSPQQIMGRLVKDFITKQQKTSAEKVYHVVVAPCFDKKLEAVYHMMENSKASVAELDSIPLDHVLGEVGDAGPMRYEGRTSEGFLEHVFKHAAKELFGLDVHEITNRDFQEVTLERDGETLLQFAAVYGFRNIQTLVQRIKKGRVPYQLVEVLSCPGGCLGGRGQAEGEVGGRPDKALVQQMEEAYISLPVCLPEVNPALHTLYQDWLGGQGSTQANAALHTQYRDLSTTQLPHMQ
ncbi:hypothetical protein CRUP_003397, partial [Coryphaenoides rupestris]